jgi:glycosyltransferase involved in cell wall biosynthesis
MIDKFKKYYQRNNGLKGTVRSVFRVVRTSGAKGLVVRTFNKNAAGLALDYQYWMAHVEEQYPADKVARMKETIGTGPKISVLMPVYNVPIEYLTACIDSVVNQYYENWELCIADDASKGREIKRVLERYAKKDERIKVVFRKKNGHISEATNSALALATGEYIALLDNDDLLKPEALLEVATLLHHHPDADMVYSDEDKISADGSERLWPSFKPDWSPDVFLTRMYLSHLGVYRTKLAKKIGGMRSEYNGSQDYDFVLRFTEQTSHIYHIPKILYHWRMIPGSTSLGAENKDYAFSASVRAKEDAMKRRNYKALQVLYADKMATQLVFYPQELEKVSILMFVTDEREIKLAQETLSNMRKRSAWEHYEILIGMNHSNMAHFFQPEERLQFFVYEGASSDAMFAELYPKTTGRFIVFIKPGCIVQTENWLEVGLGQARLAQTGVVGGLIYNEQGYIEESGLIALAADDDLIHLKRAHYGYHRSDLTLVDNLQFATNYLMMGNRFAMFEKEKADRLDVNASTVAFRNFTYLLSLKLYEDGLFNVYRGDIQLVNKQKQRVRALTDLSDAFIARLADSEASLLKHDPFYNANFETEDGNYQLKFR